MNAESEYKMVEAIRSSLTFCSLNPTSSSHNHHNHSYSTGSGSYKLNRAFSLHPSILSSRDTNSSIQSHTTLDLHWVEILSNNLLTSSIFFLELPSSQILVGGQLQFSNPKIIADLIWVSALSLQKCSLPHLKAIKIPCLRPLLSQSTQDRQLKSGKAWPRQQQVPSHTAQRE